MYNKEFNFPHYVSFDVTRLWHENAVHPPPNLSCSERAPHRNPPPAIQIPKLRKGRFMSSPDNIIGTPWAWDATYRLDIITARKIYWA